MRGNKMPPAAFQRHAIVPESTLNRGLWDVDAAKGEINITFETI